MESKRLILEVDDDLHKKIKDYAKKEQRTICATLRILLSESVEIAMDAKKHKQALVQAKVGEYRRLKTKANN